MSKVISSRTSTLEDLPSFMTEDEVAAYLCIDIKKLVRLRYEGRGPRSRKLGRDHRISRDDLMVWLRR